MGGQNYLPIPHLSFLFSTPSLPLFTQNQLFGHVSIPASITLALCLSNIQQ